MKKKVVWIVILSVVLIAGTLGFYFEFVRKETQDNDTNQQSSTNSSAVEATEPTETVNTDPIQVSWNTYSVYQSDLFDFDFVIAEVHIESEEAINLSLDSFVTSEGIQLSQYADYVDVLETNAYYLGRKNVWFSIASETNTFDGNLFIPVTDKNSDSISVSYNFGSDQSYTFDLSKNHESIGQLMYYKVDETITDGSTYEMKVSDAFEISSEEMYQNGQNMMLPSSARVFALKLNAVSLADQEVVIDSAVYEPDGQSAMQAEDSSVSSMKYQNMIGKTISESDEGCLFFIILDPDRESLQYNGVLKITFSGSDTPIEINVSMEGD